MKKSKLTLTIFLFLIISNLHATVYYVDVNGNDSNNGTSTSTPWKTIGKVNSMTFSPGDQILFMRGQTFVGSLWPKGSGSAGAPITIGDYGTGNRPVIQGPTTAPNFVSNGGFESGTTGWLGSVSTSANGYYSTNAGQISSVSSGTYQTITGLTPNTTYTLEGHLRLSNGTDVARLYAKNYGGPEVGNNISNNNSYSGSQLTFTTGPSSTSVEIGVWKMSGSANVYIDDIRLTTRTYAIKLENQQYWIVNNLETVGGSPFGICILNSVANSDLNFIRITNCTVHDVAGESDIEKREGCIVVYTSATGARFNDVIIDGCTAYNTQRWMGITVFGDFGENRRSTNIIIRNSTVYNVYGDGILEACVVNATIENCVSHDVGNMPQNKMGTPNGIWHYFTNNGVVRNCEAYNTHSPGGDGGAFDIDLLCTDVTVEYSYGHDNDAYGLAMFAAYHDIFSRGTTINSIVRYNIFYNNGRTAPVVGNDGCDQGDIWIFSWANGNFDGVQIYNNTINWNPVQSYAAIRANGTSYVGTRPRFIKNNIIISNQPLLTNVDPGLSLDNNLYYFTNSTSTNLPSWKYNNTSFTSLSAYKSSTGQDASSVYADPLFITGSSKLQAGSAATNAGVGVTNHSTRDFYNLSVPQGGRYDIGAAESYNLALNTGFDKGDLSSWTLWTSGGNGGVSTTKRSGSNSGRVGGGLAYLGQTITGLLPNTTYTFSAYVRNDTYSSPASNVWAGVKNMGTPEVQVTVGNTNGQWVPVTVNFTTGTNNTSADIYLWTTDSNTTGYIDDVKVTTVGLANARLATNVTTVNEPVAKKSTISVFPNPATSLVTINSKTSSKVDIIIFDLNGKIVSKRSLQGGSLSIDVSTLPRGLYVIKTESVEETSNHPLIVQ